MLLQPVCISTNEKIMELNMMWIPLNMNIL